jgi:threonine dehydrogenase-like Zn-dependent dehydrogenase
MFDGGISTRVLVRGESGLRLEARPRRALTDGHARVAMRVAGICRTDLYAADGTLPVASGRVLGHEGCGEIIDARVDGLAAGTRVAILPVCACSACVGCAAGRRCGAPHMLGVDRDGVFADEVVLPASALLPVPPALDDRHAAFVEPAAAALALRDAALPLERPGVVVGRGRIAELAHRVLLSLGAARVALRAPTAPVEPADRDAFDWAVETAPTEQALAWALTAVKPGGVVVLKSRPTRPVAVDLAQAVRKRLTLRAVEYAPFEYGLRWLLENDLAELFADPLPLDRHEEAFARARNDESRKIFLRCNSPA